MSRLVLALFLTLIVREVAADHWHRRHHPRALDPDFDSVPRLPRARREPESEAAPRLPRWRRAPDAPAPRQPDPPAPSFDLPSDAPPEWASLVLANIHAIIHDALDQLAANLSLANQTKNETAAPKRHLLQSPSPTPPIYSNGEPYPLDENGFYDSAPDDELPLIVSVTM